jgi:hypothetical protein
MEIVKKNIISVICGVVAILAIVASFFPLGGYIQELQRNLDDSKSKYTSLESLRTKQRNQPILKLDETTPQPLGMFPSDNVIEAAGKVVKQVESESVRMRDAAIKMNQRQQLVEGALPNPGPALLIRFRDRYAAQMAPPLGGPNNQPTGEPSKLLQEYKAGVLPNQFVIDQEKARRIQEIQETRTQKDTRGAVINAAEITDLIAQVGVEVPGQFRREAAEKSMFYVDTTTGAPTVDIAPGIVGSPRPTAAAVWWAQVALWLQRDVLEAVKETNTLKDASGNVPKNLTEAPVKFLRKVAIPFNAMYVTAAGAAAPPADPVAAADAALTKIVQAAPTGRVSNGMYDVIHLTIVADVEVERVPDFIRTISHNRLMNVTRVEMKAVDATAAQLAGYFYGTKPVTTVTLDVEALLLRSWTIPLMPKEIRALLLIPDPPPPTPAAAPAAPQAAAH